AELFAARPDIVTPVPADITQVGARAADRASVCRTVDRLDHLTLTVLTAMSSVSATTRPGEHLSLDAVHAVVEDAPAEYVDSAVDRLHGLALVWGTPAGYHVVREVHEAVRGLGGRPDAMSHELPVGSPPPIDTADVDIGRVEQLCAGTALEMVRRVDQLLGRWSETPPAVLRSGGVAVRDLR